MQCVEVWRLPCAFCGPCKGAAAFLAPLLQGAAVCLARPILVLLLRLRQLPQLRLRPLWQGEVPTRQRGLSLLPARFLRCFH